MYGIGLQIDWWEGQSLLWHLGEQYRVLQIVHTSNASILHTEQVGNSWVIELFLIGRITADLNNGTISMNGRPQWINTFKHTHRRIGSSHFDKTRRLPGVWGVQPHVRIHKGLSSRCHCRRWETPTVIRNFIIWASVIHLPIQRRF
jgi:hypothetical protein